MVLMDPLARLKKSVSPSDERNVALVFFWEGVVFLGFFGFFFFLSIIMAQFLWGDKMLGIFTASFSYI